MTKQLDTVNDNDSVVYFDWNEDRIIENVWTSIFTDDENQLNKIIDAIQLLGQSYPLLYVDWAWDFAVPLDGTDGLRDSIRKKLAEMRRET